ncbi:RDD family protein [Candidatus Fokinia solitaria]|uniref:RDD family protein n=1 Tax=Candidatus Fokinia solitaria TaxID=1802984 RepID=A0A2U8BR92_9RICK|nr:RDD family protein [Candidatus Fokinia solitaria]AWD32853.1 RDD family protein [Candidatus Fokinia solitaria]
MLQRVSWLFRRKKKVPPTISINGVAYNIPSFDRRLLGWLVDVMLLAFLLMPVSEFLYVKLSIASELAKFSESSDITSLDSFLSSVGPHFLIKYVAVQVIALLISVLYFVVSLALYGRTLGKFVTGCIVLEVDSGQKISVRTAILRTALYLVSVLPFCIGLILFIPFSKYGMALHDRCMHTVVVLRGK